SQQRAGCVVGAPARTLRSEPLASNSLERVGRRRRASRALRLAHYAGVDASGEQVARFLAPFASLGEADLGIDAQAQQLFLAAEPELVAPPLRAAGLHLEVHAAAVEHANRAIAGLRTLDRDRGQLVGRHGGGSTSVRMSITPVIYPHLPSDSSPRAWTQWDDISAVYLVYRGPHGSNWDVVGLCPGAGEGNRTLV